MTSEPPGTARSGASPFTIGDPGRAGRELPAGPPLADAGLTDVELSAAGLPGMLIRAATARGLLHRANGECRQDAFALGRHDPAAVSGAEPPRAARAIAVVCDGVGALDRSHEAAIFVSRRLATLGMAGVHWPEAFSKVNEELRAFAMKPGPAAVDKSAADQAAADQAAADEAAIEMATTAVALAVHRVAGTWVGNVAWVGDSSLWQLADDGRWTQLTGQADEENDEAEADFYSTGVRPMPTADGACATRDFHIAGSSSLFLMSDGVANPLKWSDDVKETLARWWRRPPDPFTFAAQAAFARRTHVDDRTVVAIWPDLGTGSEETSDESPRS